MSDTKNLRHIKLAPTRNVMDRGRMLFGDGITDYEVTKETHDLAVAQGWALSTDDAEVNAQAKKGVSPINVIGGAAGLRKVSAAEAEDTKPELDEGLDYSKVPVTPATATVVRTPRATRFAESAEIVPTDTGERAVGTKDTEFVDVMGKHKTVRAGGDARAGAAKKKGKVATQPGSPEAAVKPDLSGGDTSQTADGITVTEKRKSSRKR